MSVTLSETTPTRSQVLPPPPTPLPRPPCRDLPTDTQKVQLSIRFSRLATAKTQSVFLSDSPELMLEHDKHHKGQRKTPLTSFGLCCWRVIWIPLIIASPPVQILHAKHLSHLSEIKSHLRWLSQTAAAAGRDRRGARASHPLQRTTTAVDCCTDTHTGKLALTVQINWTRWIVFLWRHGVIRWLNLCFEVSFETTNYFEMKWQPLVFSFLKVILTEVKLWNKCSLESRGGMRAQTNKWWTLIKPNSGILDVCKWELKDFFFCIVYSVIKYFKNYYISSDRISFSVAIISCDFLMADYLEPPN